MTKENTLTLTETKTHQISAMRFATNNEPDNANMNSICLWANQGRDKNASYHVWHNGTDIFIDWADRKEPTVCACGHWLVKINDNIRVMWDEHIQNKIERGEWIITPNSI